MPARVLLEDFGKAAAFLINAEKEFERNRERYAFLRLGQTTFGNFRVVPPKTGIVNQVNLEYLTRGVMEGGHRRQLLPLVGGAGPLERPSHRLLFQREDTRSMKKIVHVVGTGTIGEPLIGLFTDFWDRFEIDEVTFHKRTPLESDRAKLNHLMARGAKLGYPIVEAAEDGSFVVTKHPGTGGMVTRDTAATRAASSSSPARAAGSGRQGSLTAGWGTGRVGHVKRG